MNYRLIARYIGHVLQIEAAFLVPSLLISLFSGERAATYAFLITIAATAAVGTALSLLRSDGGIRVREGIVTVSLSWVMISLFGALPFLISGAIPNFINAWFETVSGFTTTGASILAEVENLPYGILFWRSTTHWLGGMGVLVFLLAILPLAKGNGETMYLLRAESPGPSVGKLTPTIRQTTRYLYLIYVSLTVLEIILLCCGGMSLFESVTNAFATAGTGGFSVRNAGIGAYDSVYIKTAIGVFMTLFGVNFGVYYLLLMRRFRTASKNEETRVYFLIIILATVLIGVNILPLYKEGSAAFLDSFFQVSSIMTTTGFATANFDLWPQFSRILLMLLMVLGACAGSTGGGIKVSRFLILVKYLRNKMKSMLRPRSVQSVRLDGRIVDNAVVHDVTVFLIAYCAICILSVVLVSLDNHSMDTTVTGVLACVNNIGPGLGIIGPAGNYDSFSVLSKLVLSLDMLLGRLEIFPILLLFTGRFWKKAA